MMNSEEKAKFQAMFGEEIKKEKEKYESAAKGYLLTVLSYIDGSAVEHIKNKRFSCSEIVAIISNALASRNAQYQALMATNEKIKDKLQINRQRELFGKK